MDSVSRPRPPARRTRLPNSLMTCQPCVYVKNRLINLLNFGTLCIFSSDGFTVSKVSLFQTPSWLRSPRDPLRIWKLKRRNCPKRNFTDKELTVTPQLTIALIILSVLTRSVVQCRPIHVYVSQIFSTTGQSFTLTIRPPGSSLLTSAVVTAVC